METVYYNYYAFEGAKVSGGEDRRAALVRERTPRRKAEHKVISLEDYRARQAALAAEDSEEESPCGMGEERTAVRSRGREILLMGMELASCAVLIAVAAAACVIFLL